MEPRLNRNDEVADSVGDYLAASEAALGSAQALQAAWTRHFESGGEEPSPEWIADVAAMQATSDAALNRARIATATGSAGEAPETALNSRKNGEPVVVKARRRRRRENKFLALIGRPGQKLLRVVLILALVASTLVATGAGISLALEIAGFLHLIDDPVQLPVGIQLAIFIAATGLAFGFRRMLKPVDRALYGSKGLRPKGFTL